MKIPDVPTYIFSEFIKALDESGASSEMVARLRKVLIEEKNISERTLKAAVLGEEQQS